MIGHPSGLRLSRFVDGELHGKKAKALERHLESCVRCREQVAFYRSLSTAMDQPLPEGVEDGPVPDVADAVLARRAAGERGEVAAGKATGTTAAGPGPGDHIRQGLRIALGAAVCLLLIALACALFIKTPVAAAGHSELGFYPDPPSANMSVDVRYTPSFELAGSDSLRLRMRARTPETPFPRHIGVIGELRSVTLHPTEDGTYVGRVRIGPGDVYLAADVEDFTGERVDTNLGRLWNLLVAADDGKPSIAALESEYRVLERVNPVRATAWAADVTERYPDNPLGWAIRYYHDARIAPAANTDSLQAFHRQKLRELIDRRADRPKNADEMHWLFNYARWLGEDRLRDSLFAEASALDPAGYAVINWQIYPAGSRPGVSDHRLDRLERMWEKGGPWKYVLVGFGLRAAAAAHDTAAVQRWIERGLSTPSVTKGDLANDLGDSDFAAERAELREAWVSELHEWDDAERPLGVTVSEFEQTRNTKIRHEVGKLARDVAATGDSAGAMPLLKWMATDAWQPDMLEPYVARLLATGDTATALPSIGVLMADPVDGEAAARRYAPMLEGRVEDRAAFGAEGREEFRRRVRQSLPLHHRFPADTHLQFVGGTTERAGTILRDQPTIFFLLDSRYSELKERVNTFADAMIDGPGRDLQGIVVIQTSGAPLPDEVAEAPILMINDRGFEIAQRLRNFWLASYVVVDADLTVVAATSDLDTALRLAGGL